MISGNVFDSDLTANGEIALGTEFARLVKQTSPGMLFFMYSVMLEGNEFMDGVIPKARGTADRPELHGVLVDFVTDAELRLNVRNRNQQRRTGVIS